MERLGFRSFLFEADGTMRRLSLRLSWALARGRATLPNCAGQSLRNALVVLELDERGRPARIERIEGTVFDFDERGSVQASLARGAMTALEIGYEALKKPERERMTGPVVDMKLHFASKQREARHHWTPGPTEIEQIVKAIWKPGKKRPGTGPGGSRTRKRPSLTVVS